MRRFFLPPGSVQGRRLVFEGKEARYLCRVLRLKRGESIVGFTGDGTEYTAVLGILSPRRVEAIVTGSEQREEPSGCRVTVTHAVLKGGALDLVVRQCVEVGMEAFYPLVTARCVGEIGRRWEKREQRLQAIATDASRQTGRSVVPRIHPPLSWNQLLALGGSGDPSFLLWEGEKESSLKSALNRFPAPPPALLLVVGPEGGFSDEEIRQARSAGFTTVGLGPAILRAATAGVVALACVHYHFQT